MKTKLLLAILTFSIFTKLNAQSFNDYVSFYEFNNGSLENSANNEKLNVISTGNNLAPVNGVWGTNNALKIDGTIIGSSPFYSQGGSPINEFTVNFWAKMEYMQGDIKSQRVLIFRSPDWASVIHAQVNYGPTNEIQFRFSFEGQTIEPTFPANIFDNKWHNISLSIKRQYTNTYQLLSYIDGVISPHSGQNIGFNSNTKKLFGSSLDVLFSISPLRNNPYKNGSLDNIRIYDRVLTEEEIKDIIEFDKAGRARIYVNKNASNSKNLGTTWQDAHTSLKDALYTAVDNSEIWIAKGTYKPDATDITKSFIANKKGLKIYGGFNGSEGNIVNRDYQKIHSDNATILSGDLNGDDTAVELGHTSREDNSYTVLKIKNEDVVLDGLTITSGNNITLGESRHGAGILADSDTNSRAQNLSLNNCVIKDNTALWGTGLSYQPITTGSNLKINACKFENNISALGGSGVYFALTKNTGISSTAKITNCLFTNNKSEDYTKSSTSVKSIGAPAIWARAYRAYTRTKVYVLSSTFVNNSTNGTGSKTDFSTLGYSSKDTPYKSIFEIDDSIFWSNTTNNNIMAKALGNLFKDKDNYDLKITNCIDQDNFSNISTNLKVNTSNNDPKLTADYQLQTGSPAIDSGNSAKLNTMGITKDLAGNYRFNGTSMDIGAYEFYPSQLSIDDVVANENKLELYPNPVNDKLLINSVSTISKIEIYNLLGTKVLQSSTKEVNVKSLSSGIYLVRIENTDGQTVNKKIIKQ